MSALPTSARAAVERAWLGVLSARHPEVRWTLLVEPNEGRERDAKTAPRKVRRSLAAPENESALGNRNMPATASDGSQDHSVDRSAKDRPPLGDAELAPRVRKRARRRR